MGALQFARSWYCAEWSGTVSLRVDSDYRHKQESFKPNEMCGSPRSRDTGLFLSYHVVSAEGLRQGHIDRRLRQGASAGGFGRVTSAGGIRQGYIDRRIWQGATVGVHQQGCFGRGGASAGALREGGFGRGTSTFSKYYEFPVTINGNIRLYCGTTRERRQEKDYKRKQ